jgi:hypothetical protein
MFAIDLGPELTVSARGGDAISSSGRLLWSMGGHRRLARYFWDALDRDAAWQPDGQLVAPSLVGLMVGY